MTRTTRTPRFLSELNAFRRIAAGLALTLTVVMLAGVGGLADMHYDAAVTAAAAESTPTQVVVVTARRLPA